MVTLKLMAVGTFTGVVVPDDMLAHLRVDWSADLGWGDA
jgi:hypothetical protein